MNEEDKRNLEYSGLNSALYIFHPQAGPPQESEKETGSLFFLQIVPPLY